MKLIGIDQGSCKKGLHFRVKDGPRAGGLQQLPAQGNGGGSTHSEEDEVDFSEFLPDFQRVNISGEDNTGVRIKIMLSSLFSLMQGGISSNFVPHSSNG